MSFTETKKNIEWSLITVTYNSSKVLREYWSNIELPDNVEWIVVDNMSQDGSAEIAKQLGARVHVQTQNTGFAAANNLGFELSVGAFVAFVNPDVRVVVTDLPLLRRTLEEKACIVAPQLLNPDGSSQPNGRGLPFLAHKITNRVAPERVRGVYTLHTKPGEIRRVAWLTGAVVAGKRADLNRLGPWDERYFLYHEDADLGLRATESGLENVIVGDASWIHGWARETSTFRLTPWKRELTSMFKFYRRFPRFLKLPSPAFLFPSLSFSPLLRSKSEYGQKMNITIDMLGATVHSGGMKLHAIEIINEWALSFPDDSITVIGPFWARTAFSQHANVRVVPWPNESVATRFLGQVFMSALVGLLAGSAQVVSLSPIVSPLVPRSRAYCFQHDWRHKKNPDEFGLGQRLYRILWEISSRHANRNFCISRKAQQETAQHVTGARTILTENGGDHARGWARVPSGSDTTWTLTFGHHNNKRPELVIDAYSRLRGTERSSSLVVLGARGAYKSALQAQARELGIENKLVVPGFVSDQEYERLVSGADVIVLASSDEGYGLPLAEADYFGIPAVVTADSGVTDIFESLFIAEPNADSLSSAIAEATLSSRGKGRAIPRQTLPTWRSTVATMRETMLSDSITDFSHEK